jgi:hypothetical protein
MNTEGGQAMTANGDVNEWKLTGPLTAALQGRRVSLRTIQKIAVAIGRTPPIPQAVEILQE